MHCIETPRMSVLWEGRNLEWFKPERGIRQGDAISPYIFVLGSERLGHIITEVVNHGTWKGINVTREGPNISHLFFADNMVLFTEAMEDQIKTIMDCLNNFVSARAKRLTIRSLTFISLIPFAGAHGTKSPA